MSNDITERPTNEILYGYYHCGCGQKTRLDHGKPRRYIHTHHLFIPYQDRFWTKVAMRRSPDECWPWMGAYTTGGYGKFFVDGKLRLAHRIAYLLTFGGIPEGKFICHRCNNPTCCNPTHLYAGTPADNVRDRVAVGHGNFPKGVLNPKAKLTDAQVVEIRNLYDIGNVPTEIAKTFGVSSTAIYLLIHGVTWQHVP